MDSIQKIAQKAKIPQEYLEYYGDEKAKIKEGYGEYLKNNKQGKLILVTAVNPTPSGEGKTTQSIGLAMAMEKIGKHAMLVLREPSLGPVFGIKGGAVGGGNSLLEPSQDINLHFTGDFHAITSANNLLCAAIDNHIFQGNSLQLELNSITMKRAIDMNDRSLREITVESGRKSSFEITAACELMAICCLSENNQDLKRRIDQIIIGYNTLGNAVYAKELNITNAMFALLKQVLKPNLVQTSEATPCLVHLGPFANIAHGCNSIIATKYALKMADYCITEAGFGSDLGAEKFMNIKCRKAGIKPDIAVLVTTIKSLKYNAQVQVKDLDQENVQKVKQGLPNLQGHIDNLAKFFIPIVVCLNVFDTDTEQEIQVVEEYLTKMGVAFERSTAFAHGSQGTVPLANKVCRILEQNAGNFKLLYQDSDTIVEKIEKVCKEIYGANNVIYLEKAKKELKNIVKLGVEHYPICIAKTPVSFSDDKTLLGRPTNFSITVRDMKISNGAEFIIVYAGDIMTMPGLGKKNQYEKF